MNDSGGGQQVQDRIGLCARCANVQLVASARGSRFYLCRLSTVDPAFPRYPTLPVVACGGFDGVDRAVGRSTCTTMDGRCTRFAPPC
jgi:hypothetical protein